MNRSIVWILVLLSLASWSSAADEDKVDVKIDPTKFIVFDNFWPHFSPKTRPKSADRLLVNCNIIYPNSHPAEDVLHPYFWKNPEKHIPDEKAFKEAVRNTARKPGPIVIDIEHVYENIQLYLILTKWAHQAVPGRMIGWYGHGLFPEEPKSAAQKALAQKLAREVDVFFPSMYVVTQDRERWKKNLKSLIQKAHKIAPGKPVYPYIMQMYHNSGPKKGQHIEADFWKYQLETAHQLGANGVVIWGKCPDEAAWKVTEEFIATSPRVIPSVSVKKQ